MLEPSVPRVALHLPWAIVLHPFRVNGGSESVEPENWNEATRGKIPEQVRE